MNSTNENNESSNLNNETQTWEQISKAKWNDFQRQDNVSARIKAETSRTRTDKSKSINVLERIERRIAQQITLKTDIKPVDNVYDLLCSKDILRSAYTLVKGNKGSLPPGSDPNITADTFSEEEVNTLSNKLKKRTFKWKPVRRILIEKPGKKEKRPLGLPDFDDKIVQAAILLVLQAAYEPEFEEYNCNFGFRPNKDTNFAIEKIKREAQHYRYVIEGDIKGAYDNVNHSILMKTLKSRFKDNKFLQLIEQGLKCGFLLDFKYNETFLGTPQGSICSPILFNIYMQEFDKAILKLQRELENTNTQITIESEGNPQYEKLRSEKRRLQKRLEKLTDNDLNLNLLSPQKFCELVENYNYTKTIFKDDQSFEDRFAKYQERKQTIESDNSRDATVSLNNASRSLKKYILQKLTTQQMEDLQQQIKTQIRIDIKRQDRQQKETPYKSDQRLRTRITYVRYADDWVLFVRGSQDTAENIKQFCAEKLEKELQLTLSPEKTKITDLYKNKAQFLGYEILYQRNKLIRSVVRNTTTSTQRYGNIQFHPDTSSLENRFILRGLLDKKGKPREIGFLTTLQDHEIITKYNQFMMGLGNYYIRNISYPSRLNKWIYVLYYSCIKTLATKHKSTVKGILQNYGYKDISIQNIPKTKIKATNLRIISKYKLNNKEKHSILLNYKELMFKLNNLKEKYLKDQKENPNNYTIMR